MPQTEYGSLARVVHYTGIALVIYGFVLWAVSSGMLGQAPAARKDFVGIGMLLLFTAPILEFHLWIEPLLTQGYRKTKEWLA